jgi:hypothetical protein
VPLVLKFFACVVFLILLWMDELNKE